MRSKYALPVILIMAWLLIGCNANLSATPTLHGDPLAPVLPQVIPAQVRLDGVTLAVQEASIGECNLPECTPAPEGTQYLGVTLQALDLPADQFLDYKNLPQGIAIHDDTGVVTPFNRIASYVPDTQKLTLYFTVPQAARVFGLQWPGFAEIPLTITSVEPPASQDPPSHPISQANVTCNVVSLSLDPSLGTGFECETIPEATGADLAYWDKHPEYTEITLKNYPLTDSIFSPRITVYPVQRFSELLPDIVPARLADLQSLLSGGTFGSKEMPMLPPFNSVQMFQVQPDVIPFQNGKGFRYLTQYSQGIVPINNQELFYTFQGLTSDGKYWVSVILPISSPNLMADGKNPPDGQSMEEFAGNYKTYLTDTVAQLNGQSSDSFTPTINQLDAMIQTIQVKP